MYEKPQYLTPDGYRRLPKNPFKRGTALPLDRCTKRVFSKSDNGVLERHPPTLSSGKRRKGISDEAAKAIAAAIKGMLKSR